MVQLPFSQDRLCPVLKFSNGYSPSPLHLSHQSMNLLGILGWKSSRCGGSSKTESPACLTLKLVHIQLLAIKQLQCECSY